MGEEVLSRRLHGWRLTDGELSPEVERYLKRVENETWCNPGEYASGLGMQGSALVRLQGTRALEDTLHADSGPLLSRPGHIEMAY